MATNFNGNTPKIYIQCSILIKRMTLKKYILSGKIAFMLGWFAKRVDFNIT